MNKVRRVYVKWPDDMSVGEVGEAGNDSPCHQGDVGWLNIETLLTPDGERASAYWEFGSDLRDFPTNFSPVYLDGAEEDETENSAHNPEAALEQESLLPTGLPSSPPDPDECRLSQSKFELSLATGPSSDSLLTPTPEEESSASSNVFPSLPKHSKLNPSAPLIAPRIKTDRFLKPIFRQLRRHIREKHDSYLVSARIDPGFPNLARVRQSVRSFFLFTFFISEDLYDEQEHLFLHLIYSGRKAIQ